MSPETRNPAADELQFELLSRNITAAIAIGFVAFCGVCVYVLQTAEVVAH